MSAHRRCYVINCEGDKKGAETRVSIGFFKIPSIITKQDEKTKELSSERRRLWLKNLSLSSYDDINKVKICSRHFYSGNPSTLYDRTNPDWIPNLCLGDSESFSNPLYGHRKIERHERRMKRSQLQCVTPLSRKPKVHTVTSTPVSRIPQRTCGQSAIFENSIDTLWDESGVSLIFNDTDSLLSRENPTSSVTAKAVGFLSVSDEGIDSCSTPERNLSIFEENDHNFRTRTSTQTFSICINNSTQTQPENFECSTQTDIPRKDFSTRTNIEVEKELVHVSTQAGNKSVECSSQTIIRVCERFELEYAEIKIEESRKEIKKLNEQLEETLSVLNLCKNQINDLVSEVGKQENELGQHKYSEFFFKGERADEKVKYFTGLGSLNVLLVLVKQVSPYLFQKSKLTLFQQVVLTIMKLRLGVTNKDLAFRFWVSEATVARVFYNCLNALYKRLLKFVKWPERDELWASMPMCFREQFGTKCAVIIDCFEVFTCKPSSVKSRAETYSNYKSHNTVKFLIGVTPQGSISFISNGWGGRVSDKHLTENSGLLGKLLPGDLVLADRGFNIDDSVGFYYATIKYPTFTKGKTQLSPLDVESTRKLANVRIHVERVIGQLRQKYAILFSTLPIELLQVAPEEEIAILDKIAIVCSALTNLTPSVVPLD